jgi:hypothetical protein
MADNDQARILVGGTGSNAGYLEIATADDGTEPIYVRQYTGVFSSLTRTLTLLDGSGNSNFPGSVGINTDPSARLHVRASTPTSLGGLPSGVTMISDSSTNNYLLFRNTADNGTYGGIAFQDNNIGGYVVFGNAGGAGDLLYVAGYGGGQLQYGTSDSINPAARTTVASWNSTGLQINNGDMRAPVYYDSNNTSYYIDPASTSNILALSISSGQKITLQDANHFLRYQATGFSGVTIDGPQLAGHQGGELATNIGGDNWSLRWNQSGDTFSRTSSRAPIFYDSNNTAYYVDPASTSYMNSVKHVRGTHTYFERSAGVDVGAIGWHSDDIFYVAGHPGYGSGAGNDVRVYGFGNNLHLGNATYGNVLTVGGGYTQGAGSIRAPIFYDSDNTGYYVDPTSSSTSFYMNGGMVTTAAGGTVLMRHLVSEVDAWLFMENASNWGLYWKNNPSGNHAFGGYTSVGAELVGMSGSNASGNGVATTNFVGATSAIAQWMISNYTGYMWSASTIFAVNDMRTPIFYDSNDTGYYADFNSTAANCARFAGGIHVSVGNVSGQGIILADDGDIVDLNDGFCAMRFSSGVRIHSANRGGSAVIRLGNGGNIIANDNITAYGSASDRRLKENVKPLVGALDKVMQLQGCTFDWKENTDQRDLIGIKEDIGFIADEVQAVVPEMVRTDVEGYLSLRDRGFSALLVEAVKEQQKQIEDQKTEISELKSMINMLVDKVNKLID